MIVIESPALKIIELWKSGVFGVQAADGSMSPGLRTINIIFCFSSFNMYNSECAVLCCLEFSEMSFCE